MATGDVKQFYGTSNQTITLTFTSLASSATAGRQSTYVDNATNKFLDALCSVVLDMANSGSAANDKAIYIYAYGTSDGGSNYSGGCTGSDAIYTDTDPSQLGRPVCVVPALANSVVYKATFNIAQAFGGVLPERWGIVVRNYSGIALDATGSSANYQGIYGNVAA